MRAGERTEFAVMARANVNKHFNLRGGYFYNRLRFPQSAFDAYEIGGFKLENTTILSKLIWRFAM